MADGSSVSVNRPDTTAATTRWPTLEFRTCMCLVLLLVLLWNYTQFSTLSLGTSVVSRDWSIFSSKLSSKSHVGSKPCDHNILREYYKTRKYFPSEGSWVKTRDAIRSRQKRKEPVEKLGAVFHPDLCHLDSGFSKDRFLECFGKDHKISRIVTMGDSNAGHYFNATVAMLNTSLFHCDVTREERLLWGGFKPDAEYFSRGKEVLAKALQIKFRTCHGCRAREVYCTRRSRPHDNPLILEQLPLMGFLDTTITTKMPYTLGQNYSDLDWRLLTDSTPEFYLRLYLKQVPDPDLILIFPPYSHMKSLGQRVSADIRYFHTLFRKLLPDRTKLMYIPAMAEHESQRKNIRLMNKTFEGVLATERINMLNRELFSVVQENLLDVSSGVYGFFDLLGLSVDRGSWSVDGYQMVTAWYDLVTSYIWQTICNSF